LPFRQTRPKGKKSSRLFKYLNVFSRVSSVLFHKLPCCRPALRGHFTPTTRRCICGWAGGGWSGNLVWNNWNWDWWLDQSWPTMLWWWRTHGTKLGKVSQWLASLLFLFFIIIVLYNNNDYFYTSRNLQCVHVSTTTEWLTQRQRTFARLTNSDTWANETMKEEK